MLTKPLWEILVPTNIGNEGKKVRFEHHKTWDDFVEKISGGLTIQKTAKGIWICPTTSGRITDRVIPVRLTATDEEMDRIIDFTIKHYDQEAVMAYKISDTVIIKHRDALRRVVICQWMGSGLCQEVATHRCKHDRYYCDKHVLEINCPNTQLDS